MPRSGRRRHRPGQTGGPPGPLWIQPSTPCGPSWARPAIGGVRKPLQPGAGAQSPACQGVTIVIVRCYPNRWREKQPVPFLPPYLPLANEITGITEQADPQQSQWATPGHDARGNMTAVPKPVDMTGSYTCAYDAWNRLVEVKDGATVIGRYEYDGLNRRVKKHVDTQAPASPDGLDKYRHFFYNVAWQVLETRESDSENAGPEGLDPLYQYVWSMRYIDAPILRDENTDADGDCVDGSDQRLYYLTDANMNVTCLTDTGGDAVERYLYDPYGVVTFFDGSWGARSASGYDNSILFCGYYRDRETGLYHVRYRMYHAQLGRWMQRDPAEGADGNNLYEYARSRATMLTDPLGLGPFIFYGEPDMTIKHPGSSWGYECDASRVGSRRVSEGWVKTGKTCRRDFRWLGQEEHIWNNGIGFGIDMGTLDLGLAITKKEAVGGAINLGSITIYTPYTNIVTYREFYARRRGSWERWAEIKYMRATEECRCMDHAGMKYYAWEIEDSETEYTAWYFKHRSDYKWVKHPDLWVKGERIRAGQADQVKYWSISGSRAWMFGAAYGSDVGDEIEGSPTHTWDDSVVGDRCPW